jgi:D-alanine-D-alanine ligase
MTRRENEKPHVAVLLGGLSAEREVSLVTGRGFVRALEEMNYRTSAVDMGRDVAEVLARIKPDVVLNALHGRFGEDGCIQGLLEIMGIAYTHSGPRASALAMHKPMAKSVMMAAGIPVPPGVTVGLEEAASRHVMTPPYVIKPACEGSSVGVHIVRPGDNRYPSTLRDGWVHGDELVVEQFIAGRELTVGVIGDRALTVTDIVSGAEFYDYDAKYAAGGSRHILPADLPKAVFDRAMDLALEAHRLFGCRGVSRTDFRYDDSMGGVDGLFVLEINTQPGMTPTSLVPEQAAYCGMSFNELVRWMVEDASCAR